MNSTFQPRAPEGFVLGLTHRDIERSERQLHEHLHVLRAVFDLCHEANPAALEAGLAYRGRAHRAIEGVL
jgi:hypothetical protein